MQFEKALANGDVHTIKNMVETGNLIVTKKHVKLVRKYQKHADDASMYSELLAYLESQCKHSWF